MKNLLSSVRFHGRTSRAYSPMLAPRGLGNVRLERDGPQRYTESASAQHDALETASGIRNRYRNTEK